MWQNIKRHHPAFLRNDAFIFCHDFANYGDFRRHSNLLFQLFVCIRDFYRPVRHYTQPYFHDSQESQISQAYRHNSLTSMAYPAMIVIARLCGFSCKHKKIGKSGIIFQFCRKQQYLKLNLPEYIKHFYSVKALFQNNNKQLLLFSILHSAVPM